MLEQLLQYQRHTKEVDRRLTQIIPASAVQQRAYEFSLADMNLLSVYTRHEKIRAQACETGIDKNCREIIAHSYYLLRREIARLDDLPLDQFSPEKREAYLYRKEKLREYLADLHSIEWNYSSWRRRPLIAARDIFSNPIGAAAGTAGAVAVGFHLASCTDYTSAGAAASSVSSFLIAYGIKTFAGDTYPFEDRTLLSVIGGAFGSFAGAVAGYTAHYENFTFGLLDPGSVPSAVASGFLLGPVITATVVALVFGIDRAK